MLALVAASIGALGGHAFNCAPVLQCCGWTVAGHRHCCSGAEHRSAVL